HPTQAIIGTPVRGLTLRSPPSGKGSTSSHPMPWGGAASGGKSALQHDSRRIDVRRRLLATRHAVESGTAATRLRYMAAGSTCLGGVCGRNHHQLTAVLWAFVGE